MKIKFVQSALEELERPDVAPEKKASAVEYVRKEGGTVYSGYGQLRGVAERLKAARQQGDVAGLSQLADEFELKASLEGLKEKGAGVRGKSAAALGRLGPAAAPAVPQIVDLLRREGNRDVRLLAIRALAGIGPAAAEAVSTLQRLQDEDENESCRTAAAKALARINASSASALEESSKMGNNRPGAAPPTPGPAEGGTLRRKDEKSPEAPAPYKQAADKLAAESQAAREEMARRLREQLDALQVEMAGRLQPDLASYASQLNAYLQTLPQETCDEKRAVARWLSDELRRSHLALKCPNTGVASLLLVDPGDYPDVGRFQFYHYRGKGIRTASRTKLPELEVVPADLGLAPEVGQKSSWASSEVDRRAAKGTREKS